MERLSCVHGRRFHRNLSIHLEINNRRFGNECVKSQSQTHSGVAKLSSASWHLYGEKIGLLGQ